MIKEFVFFSHCSISCGQAMSALRPLFPLDLLALNLVTGSCVLGGIKAGFLPLLLFLFLSVSSSSSNISLRILQALQSKISKFFEPGHGLGRGQAETERKRGGSRAEARRRPGEHHPPSSNISSPSSLRLAAD